MSDIPTIEPRKQAAVLPAGITPQDVLAQLRKILADELFLHSERLSRFLRFCVEMTLEGEDGRLREHHIGLHVFDRPESFDPRIDSIVRVEARRLRAKLERYYERSGGDDSVQIQFRKGSYVPMFRYRERSRTKVPSGVGLQPQPRDWTGIAVLPFRPAGRGADTEFFADGLSQEVITALTGLDRVRVAARTSTFQYRDSELDVCSIGGQLNVDAVLDGTVVRMGAKFRVTARLAGVAEGIYLWADAFERDAHDVFRVQQDLALKIAESVKVHVPGRTTAVTVANTGHSEAMCAVLKGRHCLDGQHADDLSKALAFFSEALSKDARLAAAHAGIAECHALRAYYGFEDPRACRTPANSAAVQAVALSPKTPESQVAAALCSWLLDWNWAAAAELFEQAVAAAPGYALARIWRGAFLLCRGCLDEAAAEVRQAQRLDPVAVARSGILGQILLAQGDRTGAIQHYREAAVLNPRGVSAFEGLGCVHLDAGDLPQALQEFERACTLSGSSSILRGALGFCLAAVGRTTEARALLASLGEAATRGYVSPIEFARLHLGLGEFETALRWLDRAAGQRSPALVWLKASPFYSRLHGAPEFARLLAAVGLAEKPGAAQPGHSR